MRRGHGSWYLCSFCDHRGHYRHADPQDMVLVRSFLEDDLDRYPLDHLYIVSRGVLRREQRKSHPGPGHDALDLASKHLPWIRVHLDLHGLSRADVFHLGLFKVRRYPDVIQSDYGHKWLAWLDQ